MSEPWLLLLVGLPLLALWLAALVEVVRRRDLSPGRRLLWLVVLVLVPVAGLAVYVVVRPPRPVRTSGGDAGTATAEAVVVAAERRQRGELSEDAYRSEIAEIASRD